MEDSAAFFRKYFDQNQNDLRRYFRLGEEDGKNELPKTSDAVLSSTELEILNEAEGVWSRFKSTHSDQHNKIEKEIEQARLEIEGEISSTIDKISDDKNSELDLLDAQYGTGTSEYKAIKNNYDKSESELSDVRKLLNRALDVKFVHSYLPVMIILGIAEIPVNRLAFELFFEQSPLISLALSGAIGALFVFFAHIIGSQLRNTQCIELNRSNSGTYIFLIALIAISLIVMYFLGVMREQLVAVQASANLNLEDMLNEDTQNSFSGGITSLAIGSKGLMLLLLNIAIFISGMILAYFRHDPHPQYEYLSNKYEKAKQQLLKYEKQYEMKQIEMLREYNQKHSFNKSLQRQREAQIESIMRSRQSLSELENVNKDKLIDAISKRIRNYRDGNLKSRTTEKPKYFDQSIYALIGERIK